MVMCCPSRRRMKGARLPWEAMKAPEKGWRCLKMQMQDKVQVRDEMQVLDEGGMLRRAGR